MQIRYYNGNLYIVSFDGRKRWVHVFHGTRISWVDTERAATGRKLDRRGQNA